MFTMHLTLRQRRSLAVVEGEIVRFSVDGSGSTGFEARVERTPRVPRATDFEAQEAGNLGEIRGSAVDLATMTRELTTSVLHAMASRFVVLDSVRVESGDVRPASALGRVEAVRASVSNVARVLGTDLVGSIASTLDGTMVSVVTPIGCEAVDPFVAAARAAEVRAEDERARAEAARWFRGEDDGDPTWYERRGR